MLGRQAFRAVQMTLSPGCWVQSSESFLTDPLYDADTSIFYYPHDNWKESQRKVSGSWLKIQVLHHGVGPGDHEVGVCVHVIMDIKKPSSQQVDKKNKGYFKVSDLFSI